MCLLMISHQQLPLYPHIHVYIYIWMFAHTHTHTHTYIYTHTYHWFWESPNHISMNFCLVHCFLLKSHVILPFSSTLLSHDSWLWSRQIGMLKPLLSSYLWYSCWMLVISQWKTSYQFPVSIPNILHTCDIHIYIYLCNIYIHNIYIYIIYIFIQLYINGETAKTSEIFAPLRQADVPLTDFLLQRWPSFFSTSSVARRTVARGRVWMAEEVVQSGGAARKTNSLLLKIAIEIVDLPMNSMVIFNSYVKSPEGIPSKKRS